MALCCGSRSKPAGTGFEWSPEETMRTCLNWQLHISPVGTFSRLSLYMSHMESNGAVYFCSIFRESLIQVASGCLLLFCVSDTSNRTTKIFRGCDSIIVGPLLNAANCVQLINHVWTQFVPRTKTALPGNTKSHR
jgi:hypothetical protein